MKMKTARWAFCAVLLAASTSSGSALANMPAPDGSGGAICGAWEWLHGTSFRRFCSEGSLYWYEYKSL